MKALFFVMTCALAVSLQAQVVTLRFENSSNNYEVKIDGRSYFSKDVDVDNRNRARILAIDDLTVGTHRIDVYQAGENVSNTGTAMYSNTFQLREGYDMVIAVKRNDQVAFTERRSINPARSKSENPMSDADFAKLQQSISSKWSQSARLTAAKTAINTQSNYFTTEQIGQLISLINTDVKKLELAKLGYHKVTDPGNFSEVSLLLNSQASRDEMNKYIASTAGTVAGNDPSGSDAVMTSSRFNTLVRTVKNQYQQEGKIAVLTDAFNNTANSFTSSQLQQLISLISAESNRLALAKLAYGRVSDKQNFSSLNTLFTKQSTRDELSYYVKYGVSQGTETYTNRVPMADDEFRSLQRKASLHFRQSSVVTDVKAAFSNTTNYYSTAQIRGLLSLISAESDRLSLAKLAYHRAAEPHSFTQLFDLFATEASKNALSNYLNSVAINQ